MQSFAFIISSSLAGIVILVAASVSLIAVGIVSLEREKRRQAEEALRIANAKLAEKVELQAAELSKTTGKWKIEIEKRQIAEQYTRQQHEWWRVTLSSIGDAVITADREGRINYLNSSAETLTGWTNEEAAGKPLACVFGIIEEQTRQSLESPIEKVLREGVIVDSSDHTMLAAKDGRELPIDSSGAPIRNDKGEIIGAVLIFRDSSARKIAETAREQLLEREREARLQAETANRLKDEFVATVSHELRAPLNAILGWSRVLRKSRLDEQAQTKAIETIERSAENQARLIEDLLDISRIVSGKLRLDMRTVDPAAIIDMALETVAPAAEAKNIKLKTDLDPTTGSISGDSNRLQQVVWNLLSNAVKFTPKEGEVSIKLCREDSQTIIKVSDNGQGISNEFLPYVFDHFRQADSSTTRKQGGIGLGLAITRHLVELHGGTVTAESGGIGKGAAFTVRLPIMPLQTSEQQKESSRGRERSIALTDINPILNGLSILIVDDEEDSRQLLIQVLSDYGAKVAAADSAAKAIEMMNAQLPDLLVSDIAMPDEDGYSLIRKVRKLKFGSNGMLPAIAITAFAQKKDRMRALAAGFQQHFSKPVEPEELAAAIASLTGRPSDGGA